MPRNGETSEDSVVVNDSGRWSDEVAEEEKRQAAAASNSNANQETVKSKEEGAVMGVSLTERPKGEDNASADA